VRRLIGPATAGFHRMNWDLREPAPVLSRPQRAEPDEDEAFGPPQSGPAVLPGKYQVALAQRMDGTITPVTGAMSFSVTGPAGELTTLTTFQQKVSKLQRQVVAALETANTLKQNLATMKRALYETPGASTDLINTSTVLDKRTDEILLALRGDTVLRAHDENTSPAISERVQSIQMTQRMSTAKPTTTQMKDYEIASAALAVQQAKLKALAGTDVKKLEGQLEALGAPYTPKL